MEALGEWFGEKDSDGPDTAVPGEETGEEGEDTKDTEEKTPGVKLTDGEELVPFRLVSALLESSVAFAMSAAKEMKWLSLVCISFENFSKPK